MVDIAAVSRERDARAVGDGRACVKHDVEAQVRKSVILIPEALYHVDELGPIHEELSARGVKSRFMVAPQTVESAVYALGAYGDSVLPFAPEHLGTAAAVVSLNDWGRLQPVLSLANDAGVPTFAKVEGVQDFDDVDTGRYRGAYRTAGVVLGQGENDVEAFRNERSSSSGAPASSDSGTRERSRPALTC